MPDDPRADLPPALRHLRRDLHRAWLEAERREARRSRRRLATVLVAVLVGAIPAAIAATSLFTRAPSPTPRAAPHAARAAEGSTASGDWQLALLRRGGALCVVLRTTGAPPVVARACDPTFPRRRSLTAAVAVNSGGTWVYGLSSAAIRAVTVRAGTRSATAVTAPLDADALRFARAAAGLRGFVAMLPQSIPEQPAIVGLDKAGGVVARLQPKP